MAFTSVVTHATGDVFPASDWNTYVRDNLAYLHGDAGVIALNNDVQLGASVTIGSSPGLLFDNAGGLYASGSGAGNFLVGSTVVGDATDYRFSISQSGALAWGTGALARDTSLQRVAAGVLQVGTTTQAGRMAAVAGSAAGLAFSASVTTDANPRFSVQGDGTINWGVGSSAADTTLDRQANGQLAVGSTSTGVGNIVAGGLSTSGGVATWTPNAAILFNRYNMTAAGALTVAAPSNPPAANQSAIIVICIHNASGGTITISTNAVYSGTFSPPTNGNGNIYVLGWNTSTSKWQILIGPVGE